MTIRHGQTNKFNHPISWNFGVAEGYQFAGTGATRVQTYKSPLGTTDRYFPSLQYVLVKPLNNSGRPIGHDGKPLKPGDELCVHAVPMISNFDAGECTQDKTKYKWDYIEDLAEIHNMYGTPPSKLKAWLINQPDGMDVSYWYGIKANPFLITTWSQGIPTTYPPVAGFFSAGDPAVRISRFDNGYDFCPTILRVNSDPVRTKLFEPNGTKPDNDTDWYRHGCIKSVEFTDDKGDIQHRDFLIYYDIEHKFHAFPVAARLKGLPEGMSAKTGYVPPDHVVIVPMPWPSIIDKSKIGNDIEKQYRPDWSFSHDGSKAVCIARIIDEPWTDNGIQSSAYYNGSVVPLNENSPILIEIVFDIQVTGDDLKDFTFNIELGRMIYPQEDGRAIVSAQYAVCDFKDHGVEADDLIILEYEMYMTNMFVPTQPLYAGMIARSSTTSIGCHPPYTNPPRLYTARYNEYPSYHFAICINKPGTMYGYWITPYKQEIYTPWESYSYTISIDNECLPAEPPEFDISLTMVKLNDLTVNTGSYLVDPNKATVAKIKNLKKTEVDGPVLFEWLAHYSSNQVINNQPETSYSENVSDAYANKRTYVPEKESWLFNHVLKADYNAVIDDFGVDFNSWFEGMDLDGADVITSSTKRQYIYYNAAIQNIELSTLSFLIAPNLSMSGDECMKTIQGEGYFVDVGIPAFRFIDDRINKIRERNESISGAMQVLVCFGVEQHKQYSGHESIEQKLEGMFRLTDTTPDFDKYKQFDLRSTIDSEPSTLRTLDYTDVTTKTIYLDSYHFNCYECDYVRFINIHGDYVGGSEELFTLSNVQDVTVHYKTEVHKENRVFNCSDIMADTILGDIGIAGYFANSNLGNDFMIVSPTLFEYFDNNIFLRPGVVAQKRENLLTTNMSQPKFSGYPFGKIYFNRVYNLTINPTNNKLNKLRTHPNGSWAVMSLPIITFTGKHSITVEPILGSQSPTVKTFIGAGTIEKKQIFIDKIHMVYLDKNNTDKFIKDTSHIDMMNLAFNKTLKKDDYNFGLTNHGDDYVVFYLNGNYSGGVSIIKKWENPSLLDNIFITYNGINNVYTGFDYSKIIGVDFMQEKKTDSVFKDVMCMSWISNRNRRFKKLENTFLRPSYDMYYNMSDYCPTPVMESLFYYNNTYIDRKENKQ